MAGLIKSNVQLGDSATATQNFTLTVPSTPDGTVKLARGNAGETTQDILTVDANGKVDLPAMTTIASGTGCIELPNGLLLQWGNGNTSAGSVTLNFATPFSLVLSAVAVASSANTVCVVAALTNSTITIYTHTGNTGNAVNNGVRYFAIGTI